MDRSDVAALVNLEQHVDAIHSFFTFIKVIPVVTEFRARPGSFSGTRLNYWRVRSYGWVYLPEGRMAITIYFHGYSYQSSKPMIAPASEVLTNLMIRMHLCIFYQISFYMRWMVHEFVKYFYLETRVSSFQNSTNCEDYVKRGNSDHG